VTKSYDKIGSFISPRSIFAIVSLALSTASGGTLKLELVITLSANKTLLAAIIRIAEFTLVLVPSNLSS